MWGKVRICMSCKKKIIEFLRYGGSITRANLYELMPEYDQHTIRGRLSELIKANKIVMKEAGTNKKEDVFILVEGLVKNA